MSSRPARLGIGQLDSATDRDTLYRINAYLYAEFMREVDLGPRWTTRASSLRTTLDVLHDLFCELDARGSLRPSTTFTPEDAPDIAAAVKGPRLSRWERLRKAWMGESH